MPLILGQPYVTGVGVQVGHQALQQLPGPRRGRAIEAARDLLGEPLLALRKLGTAVGGGHRSLHSESGIWRSVAVKAVGDDQRPLSSGSGVAPSKY